VSSVIGSSFARLSSAREVTSERSAAYLQHELLDTVFVLVGPCVKQPLRVHRPPHLIERGADCCASRGAPRPANAVGAVFADLLTDGQMGRCEFKSGAHARGDSRELAGEGRIGTAMVSC